MKETSHFTAIVIGSGFGGSMTAIPLADAFTNRKRDETVLILERGTWWTTPVSTVQDKEVDTYQFLNEQRQPVQYWSSRNDFLGFIDIFTRCFRRPENIDGLYEMTRFGRRGVLGIGGESDGVSVVRACGVGGGSLVSQTLPFNLPITYSKILAGRWTGTATNGSTTTTRHATPSASALSRP